MSPAQGSIPTGPDIVPALAGRAAYDPGPVPAAVRLRLDRNEGPPPPEAARTSLASMSDEVLRRYAGPRAVEQAVAARNGLDPAQVLVTNGGDEGIDRCCRLVLAPGRRAVVHDPTFEMIERSAELAGAGVTPVPWDAGVFPREAMLTAATAPESDPVRLIAVVTPNNPTGGVASVDDVLALADACPRALVLVDAAYIEFHDPAFPGDVLAAARPNVVVVRTFSKAWGLAGLRCGWLAGPAELIGALRSAGGPYAVSAATLAVVGALLDAGVEPDPAYLARVAAERDALTRAFIGIGASVPASRANFVTPVLASPAAAARIAEALAADGIAIRRFPAPRADQLRITCPGRAADWDLLATSLADAGVPVPTPSLTPLAEPAR